MSPSYPDISCTLNDQEKTISCTLHEQTTTPDYEAIGRCVVLRQKIETDLRRLAEQQTHFSHLSKTGIVLTYSDDDKAPQLYLEKNLVNDIRAFSEDISDIYLHVHQAIEAYNQQAERAEYPRMTLKGASLTGECPADPQRS